MVSSDIKEEIIDLKLKKLAILEQKQKYRDELPHLYGHKKYKWQQAFCDAKFTHKKRFVCAANQIGKVQPNDEIILTPKGYKKNGDIVKGDYVYGSNGIPTKVLAVFPHKDWEFYKVTFDDGSYTFCGLEHKWLTTTGKVMSTQEIRELLPYGISINYCKDVQFPEGDYKSRISEYYDSAKYNFFSKTRIYRIPDSVLFGNVERRLGFLNGVMDRDGKCLPSKNGGSLSFPNKYHPAIKDFIKLVTSLGGWAKQSGHILLMGMYHHELFHAFGNKMKLKHGRKNAINVKTFKSIEFHTVADGQCMTVDNEDSTYLTSKFNIVTHNSSIQIRDVVDIATRPKIWTKLWPVLEKNKNAIPYGWYLYPNQDTVMQEFETKWIKEILPKGSMESHPVYGWRPYIQTKVLKYIDFNSGFRLYFKTYNQNVMDLQSGTVWLIACFTKGNTVYCEDGIKDISEVSVGDKVLTRYGFEVVDKVFSHKRPVITRVTNTGKVTTGTSDHPFIMGNDTKEFGSLTSEDEISTVPLWKYLYIYKQTFKLCYLKEFFKEGIARLMSLSRKTIFTGHQKHSKDYVQTEQTVYNIQVRNNHEYYINGLLVHNCDEELKESLLPELEARLFSTSGLLSMVFTATIGQDIWRRTIECIGRDDEQFPDAWKAQVSMYDCLEYADGSDTPWTKQKIGIAIKSCKNDAEVARRIYGKFVMDTGILYTGFNRKRNFKPYPIKKDGTVFLGVPKGWNVYSAVDYGSCGKGGHPAAIIFLAVNKTFTKIRAVRAKRFDNYEDMTAGDLYKEYVKIRKELGVMPVKQVYDGAAKDFGTIAIRSGDSFYRANKDHVEGELALNSALKTGIFVIYDDDDGNGDKLCRELESLTVGYNKKTTTDDLTDAARYAIVSIPINWNDVLSGKKVKKKNEPRRTYNDRQENGKFMSREEEETNSLYYKEEFDYWNGQMGFDL